MKRVKSCIAAMMAGILVLCGVVSIAEDMDINVIQDNPGDWNAVSECTDEDVEVFEYREAEVPVTEICELQEYMQDQILDDALVIPIDNWQFSNPVEKSLADITYADENCTSSHGYIVVDYNVFKNKRYEPLDGYWHAVFGKVDSADVICADCGMEFGKYAINREIMYVEPHYFNYTGGNDCDGCGMTRINCNHTRYNTYTDWSMCTYVDDNYHIRYIFKNDIVAQCTKCDLLGLKWNGKIIWDNMMDPAYSEIESKWEKHRFANGVCLDCGNSKNNLSVTLSVKQTKLGKGEKFSLSPKVTPSGMAGKLKYKSIAPAIASVSNNGVITAKKKGTTVVMATVGGTTFAHCVVTVKNAPMEVALNKTKIILKKGKTYQLKVTLPAGTASNKLSWNSANKSIATVNSKGLIIANKKGKTTIRIKTYNGKEAKCVVTVK